ncbi:MAG TPA: SAM-dependent methyltransferase [Pseudonocardiaceae bacterium]|nr:SAM-dependent methyltransferase [Pseudonocardiaceae bacterium]
MSTAESAPVEPACELDRPNVARVYNYYLGGNSNWAIDREFGKTVLNHFPQVRSVAMATKLFANRAVRYLVRHGITQFIDVGAGMPAIGNTHEIADEIDSRTRVVYLDSEPVAVAHSQLLLDRCGNPSRHAAVHADLRRPDELWARVDDAGVLDLDAPIALLLTSVLHVRQPGPDGVDVGAQAVARCRELLAPGSFLVISHLTADGVPEHSRTQLAALKKLYDTQSSPLILRGADEVRELFGDFDLVEPGLTWTPQWHPEQSYPEDGTPTTPTTEFSTPNESVSLGGVGKKR